MQPLTTIIIARNAEDTIERAVGSVMDGGRDWPILLVDDFSDDQTVARAKALAGDQLRVVRPDQHIGTGNARQTGLDHVETDYAVWLDADDRAYPDRMSLCLNALKETSADMIIHAVMLKDGASDHDVNPLPIPDFLNAAGGIVWQLERNYLPYLGPAFCVSSAREAGFDPSLTACEDYDHFLRLLMMGGRIKLINQLCLDHYAYAGSVSRNLDHHQAQLQKIYQRHDFEAISTYLKDRVRQSDGLSDGSAAFILASRAVYAQDYTRAENYAQRIDLGDQTPAAPYQRPLSVLRSYILGVCAFKTCDFSLAQRYFEDCLLIRADQADVMNNLGAVYAAQGKIADSEKFFKQALGIKSDYLDAQLNLKNLNEGLSEHWRVTTHPLRFFQTRSEY